MKNTMRKFELKPRHAPLIKDLAEHHGIAVATRDVATPGRTESYERLLAIGCVLHNPQEHTKAMQNPYEAELIVVPQRESNWH